MPRSAISPFSAVFGRGTLTANGGDVTFSAGGAAQLHLDAVLGPLDRERLREVLDARARGVEVVTLAGAADAAQRVLPPTLLLDPGDDARVMQDEIFGPVLATLSFRGVEQAIEIANDVLYVLEANPRASRTVPFVSKALGITLAKAASLVMVGKSIASLKQDGHLPKVDGTYIPAGSAISVKEAVLPFKRFATKDGRFVDSLLGPEMRSTGEVMGIDVDFPTAFAKSQAAAGSALPTSWLGLVRPLSRR